MVTQVCRCWRTVALRSASLWGKITLSTRLEWTAELLRRSGEAPLYVAACVTGDRRERLQDSLDLILGHLYRIRQLFLGADKPLRMSVAKLLAGKAPMLQKLVITGVFHNPHLLDETDEDMIKVPAMLYNNGTPQLETLEVDVVQRSLALPGPFASTLKHLRFHTIHVGLARWPDLRTMLNVLGMVHSLQTFVLERDGTLHFSDEEVADLPRVRLPHLSAIELHSDAAECADILDHLDLPALESLDIVAEDAWDGVHDLAAALESKIETIGSAHRLDILGFGGASGTGAGPVQIKGYGGDDAEDSTRCMPHTTLFDIELRTSVPHANIIPALCRHVSFKDVWMLNIVARHIDQISKLILETTDNVVFLNVIGELACSRLPQLLAPCGLGPQPNLVDASEGMGEEDYVESCRMPNLYSLAVIGARLNTRAQFEAGEQGTWVRRLCHALEERTAVGAEVTVLSIRECSNVNKAMLRALEDVLDEVDGEANTIAEDTCSFWEALGLVDQDSDVHTHRAHRCRG